MVVAIDGPASSGKSTTAREVAKVLGFTHIDTGAMYRALTLAALRRNVRLEDDEELTRLAREVRIELGQENGVPWVTLDGEDVSQAIRTPEVDRHVSRVSEVAGVREEIVRQQRVLAGSRDVVMEGRDIGTVVFPNAEVKVFLVADPVTRARRRKAELEQRGIVRPLEEILSEIVRRDEYDSSRAVSPLKRAEGAEDLDTSELSIQQQVDEVVARVRRYLEKVHTT
ncbi:MAG TPA: (d)CMP kinase [Candidatus Latescibacteria bacterium]|nr:(d)CMP kinase [Candidatus Latescibacterota bacterium]HOS65097.1 (d)CMP kinase [Candidatus Latescibacterota bacterium]HPK74326.1 (d)CMP kinase [Candidatus Latescibacterota bacterium]